MVNPLVEAYITLCQGRDLIGAGERGVFTAYRGYQEALEEHGPCPPHGWHRQALVAREDRLARALDGYVEVVRDALGALVALQPPTATALTMGAGLVAAARVVRAADALGGLVEIGPGRWVGVRSPERMGSDGVALVGAGAGVSAR